MKNKIQSIIEAHKAANVPHAAAIEAWKKDTMYSDSYKQQAITALKSEMEKNDVKFKQQMKALIAEIKAATVGGEKQKPADYQVQIANALKFIEIAGNKLTDEQAAGILKPFLGDVETMNLFRNVIDSVAPQSRGLTGRFEKTFAETDKMVALTNNFKTIEELAGSILDSNNSSLEQAVRVGIFTSNVEAIHEATKTNEGVN